ncbi:MAG TPA: UDP-N-acetylglucosamine 2-epimerase [Defluviitoga tunisiensis]|nr:UDP-N-acetylglucosamine 2-epimerase [Defluviitoga tunisiensis]
MKKILFFTSARSDFGTIRLLIKEAKKHKVFEAFLLISGSHFLESKGYTYKEIEYESLLPEVNTFKLSEFPDGVTPHVLCVGIGETLVEISEFFSGNNFDGIVICGDRYELFTITVPALLHKIPVFHISGGEITEGVIDDNVRHATTKLAHIHFVANRIYARNVSLMGEEDWRIQIVGECELDNIYNGGTSSKKEIMEKFSINLDNDTLLVTMHPSTLDLIPFENQIDNLLKALEKFTANFQIVFTAPGNEIGADYFTRKIREFVDEHPNSKFVEHFGSRNYISVLKFAKVVIGNSSSGIVEAPSLGTPTINIGNRQRNRLSADSVIHVSYEIDEIVKALQLVLSSSFREKIRNVENPYDPYKDGKGAERIVNTIINALELKKEKVLIKKFDNSLHEEEWNFLLRRG